MRNRPILFLRINGFDNIRSYASIGLSAGRSERFRLPALSTSSQNRNSNERTRR